MKESVAVVGWLITFLAGVIAPAVFLVLIGMTSYTLLRSGAAGRFVSINACAGGIFSPNLTTVQTTTGSIVISNTFSAPRNQPLVVRETLKDGLQLCAQGKPDTCAGLAGSWAGDMKPIPHARPRLAGQVLDQRLRIEPGKIAISTMHLAKGLEFRAVAVIACDDEVIPSQERIDAIADNADLEEVYNTERHLLNVACTRARDRLWVSGVEPASEFLSDLEATTVENVVGTQAP